MCAQRNILRTVFVPALATVVVGGWAGAELYIPTDSATSGIATHSAMVTLLASIDTDSDAVGISESSLYSLDQADLDTAMSELQSMGVTQVRVLLPWEHVEWTEGTYNWTQADQLMDTAAKYNISVDAVITTTPPWASQYSAGGWIADAAPDPSSYAAYAKFAATVATRYADQIGSIEVSNEPNGANGWYPSPDPAAYTQLLKDAYTAIKAANPKMAVVGGVLGAGLTMGSLTVNPVDFLQQMYTDGAAGYFDALSFHPYNDTGTFSNGAYYANSALDQLKDLQALMAANGDGDKLVWATEYGESSKDAGGEAQQAAFIQDFLDTWSSLNGVGPMFIYSLLDDDENNNMGLLTDDYTPKQALAVVEAWLKAHPTDDPDPADAAALSASADPPNPMAAAVSTVQQMVSGMATAMANLAKTFTSSMGVALASMSAAVSRFATALTAAISPRAAQSMTARVALTAASPVTAPKTSPKTSMASTPADAGVDPAPAATTVKSATRAVKNSTAGGGSSAGGAAASGLRATAATTPEPATAVEAKTAGKSADQSLKASKTTGVKEGSSTSSTAWPKSRSESGAADARRSAGGEHLGGAAPRAKNNTNKHGAKKPAHTVGAKAHKSSDHSSNRSGGRHH
jgi:hypothetical protein